jgi:hypothetical protein
VGSGWLIVGWVVGEGIGSRVLASTSITSCGGYWEVSHLRDRTFLFRR